MLALLLDENVARRVAEQAALKEPGLSIVSVHDWHGGAYLHADDEAILEAAGHEGMTLVTFDLRTVRPLLKEWGETGRSHAGVIFVDERSIGQNDYGAQVHALLGLWKRMRELDFTDRTLFLQRSGQ